MKKDKPKSANQQDQKWYQKIVVQAATVAAFTLLGGVALAYFNGWLSAKTLDAKLEKPTIETNVKLSDFLNQMNISPADYSAEDLQQIGYVVHFQVQLIGFKGRTCKARWELFDDLSKSKFVLPSWDKVQEPVELTAEANTDSASPNFWVPPVIRNGAFFVRVRIYDDRGVELTYADTLPVSSRSPGPGASPPKPSPAKS